MRTNQPNDVICRGGKGKGGFEKLQSAARRQQGNRALAEK